MNDDIKAKIDAAARQCNEMYCDPQFTSTASFRAGAHYGYQLAVEELGSLRKEIKLALSYLDKPGMTNTVLNTLIFITRDLEEKLGGGS